MSQKTYTLEHHMVLHDDATGDRLIVRPDRDALGLIEIISITAAGTEEANLILRPQQAGILANILRGFAPPEEHPQTS